jgi:hypothetical protein
MHRYPVSPLSPPCAFFISLQDSKKLSSVEHRVILLRLLVACACTCTLCGMLGVRLLPINLNCHRLRTVDASKVCSSELQNHRLDHPYDFNFKSKLLSAALALYF